MNTIVFTGGGTGGHVYPGIAVIDRLPAELQRRVVWVGSHRGVERCIASDVVERYYAVPTGKLRRYFDLQNVVDLFRVAAGIVVAFRLLRRIHCGVVFSKGGFVAVPVVIAAAWRGIPVIAHESDADFGLATRLSAPFARRVLVAYEETRRALSPTLQARTVVTGNPVRRTFFEADPTTALIGLEVEQNGGVPVVLVTGGSLGARQINELLLEIIAPLSERAIVIHQCGEHSTDMLPAFRKRSRDGRYHGQANFTARFPALMRRADVVIARAGAGTLWEIAVTASPAVLIPLSTGASRGDQIRNAERYARGGAARVLSDEEATAEALFSTVSSLLDDRRLCRTMRDAARRWANGDAARRIAAIIGEYAVEPTHQRTESVFSKKGNS